MPMSKKDRYPDERRKVAEWLQKITEPEGFIIDLVIQSLTTKENDKFETIRQKAKTLFEDLQL